MKGEEEEEENEEGNRRADDVAGYEKEIGKTRQGKNVGQHWY